MNPQIEQATLFLDLDGVLHTENYDELLMRRGEDPRDRLGPLFDPEAVARLADIVDATGAQIVITSSWRYMGQELMEEIWQVRHLPGKIVDCTPLLSANNISALIDDSEELIRAYSEIRGWEIHAYLLEHPDLKRYVILDDETCMRPYMQSRFVAIDSRRGITAEDARRAIAILTDH